MSNYDDYEDAFEDRGFFKLNRIFKDSKNKDLSYEEKVKLGKKYLEYLSVDNKLKLGD